MKRLGRELVSWARFFWTTLTSMRTALILLFILGLAAIPGSLLPQRPTNPSGVRNWLAANPGWAWIDRLGAFDVFGSAWFAAIYLLLFVSLIGCILPRTAQFAKALRAQPSPPPGRLGPPVMSPRSWTRPRRTCEPTATASAGTPTRSPPSAATSGRPATWSSTSAC